MEDFKDAKKELKRIELNEVSTRGKQSQEIAAQLTRQHLDAMESIQKGTIDRYDREMQTFRLETALANRVTTQLKPFFQELYKLQLSSNSQKHDILK